jgi:hypothetical protein
MVRIYKLIFLLLQLQKCTRKEKVGGFLREAWMEVGGGGGDRKLENRTDLCRPFCTSVPWVQRRR